MVVVVQLTVTGHKAENEQTLHSTGCSIQAADDSWLQLRPAASIAIHSYSSQQYCNRQQQQQQQQQQLGSRHKYYKTDIVGFLPPTPLQLPVPTTTSTTASTTMGWYNNIRNLRCHHVRIAVE
jgi:hypothetical protein